MPFESWRALYESDLQGLLALLPVPALFLFYLLRTGPSAEEAAGSAEARFVRLYALLFCVETLLDPLVTGPLARRLGEGTASYLALAFVLLGDFRVFALVFGLAAVPGRLARALREAALWTAAVPIASRAAYAGLDTALGGVPDRVQWLLYELAFLAMALWLRARVVPARVSPERASARDLLRAATAYAALYYALWAAADAMILFAGWDAGWLLRIVPNQLYYAFWVPFVWLRWRRKSETSSSVHASR